MANLSIFLFPSLAVDPLAQLPLISDKAKGRGYASSGGIHTVQYSTTNGFVGILKMQGTLVASPSETDWFDIDNTVLGDNITPVPDQVIVTNFTGNFVWVRAVIVQFTAGQINRVLFNHN